MRLALSPIVIIMISALALYLAQKLILPLYISGPLSYSPERITLFLAGFAVFNMILFLAACKISFDNAGFVFIACSMIKMVTAYFFIQPLLEASSYLTIEKINFFVVFILFLAIETIIAIRILNNKQ